MKVVLISNSGAGVAGEIEVRKGMTIDGLFKELHEKGSPVDCSIRVNRNPVSSSYVLQEGDRVVIAPAEMEGAAPVEVEFPAASLQKLSEQPSDFPDLPYEQDDDL